MNNFIHKHWSGEYSLARAYLVNGLLIDYLAVIIAGVAGPILGDLGEDRESILALFNFLWIVLNVWQTGDLAFRSTGWGLLGRISYSVACLPLDESDKRDQKHIQLDESARVTKSVAVLYGTPRLTVEQPSSGIRLGCQSTTT